MDIKVTDRAAAFLRRMILFNGGSPGKTGLRLFVKEGGCSGLSYDFALSDTPLEGDEVVRGKEFLLFVPESSMVYLKGIEIDSVDNLMQTGLVFNNPNASGQCGCGTSFNVPGGPGGCPGGCSKPGGPGGEGSHGH